MALRRIAAAAGLVLLGATGQVQAQLPGRLVPGTYRQIDTVTKKPLPVGSMIIVADGKGGKVGFSLSAIRQLDSNTGDIAGLLTPSLPQVWTHTSAAGKCRLTFQGLAHGLKVTQDADFGDCGFGAGVSANGTYLLVADKPIPT